VLSISSGLISFLLLELILTPPLDKESSLICHPAISPPPTAWI